MAQQFLLSIDKKRVTVTPGAKTEFNVTIQNLTTLLDDVAVTVEGIEISWVQVVPPHVPVFAQGEASVRVIVQPPVDPSRALCGIYPLQVSGRSQEQAGQQADTRVDLEVQFGGDYRIEVGSGTTSGGQEATFPFTVHNDANAPLVLRCSGEDPRNLFWYKFDPFQIAVPPGSVGTAVLSVRARQTGSEDQTVVFTLSAQGEWSAPGMAAITAPPHQVNGQWGQAAPTTLAVTIEPFRQDGSASSSYRVQVNNPGPQPESTNLEFSSAGGQLGFKFDPAQVSLAPLGQSASVLLVWLASGASGAAAVGGQAIDFWVTARPLNPRTRPGSVKTSFSPPAAPIQKRPGWLIPAIVIGVLLLLACVGIGVVFTILRTR
jgi:hypothetical protein